MSSTTEEKVAEEVVSDSCLVEDSAVENEWSKRKVIVTGAGKGIGRGIAERLLKLGAAVVAISRTESDLLELQRGAGDCTRVHIIAGDLGDDSFLETLAANADVGTANCLVNCAGIAKTAPFLETEIADFRRMHRVNVEAVFQLSQTVARLWVARKVKGSIVNISSCASLSFLRQHTAYTCSKHALDALTATMALELGEFGIRVNSVNPTAVLTAMGKKCWADPKKAKPLLERIPLRRLVQVSEVTDAVVFLLSDAAKMINAQRLAVDGGLSGTR